MFNQGFQLHTGRHTTTGVFACFWKPGDEECFSCGQPIRPVMWDEAGHSYSVVGAFMEARDLALGVISRPALTPEHFGVTGYEDA